MTESQAEEQTFPGLVFLDLDGTIEDSRQDMAESANGIRKSLGLPTDETRSLYAHVMKGMEHLYRNCFPECLEDPTILDLSRDSSETRILDKLSSLYHQHYSANIVQHTRCYPGMEQALRNLASRYYLALYTNKPEGLSRLLLERLGLLSHFHLLYGGDSLPESKPSALPLNTGIESMALELGIQDPGRIRQRTVMIGDSSGDMKAARDAQVVGIWAKYGYYDSIEEPVQNYIAGSPEMLPELVERAILD